MSKDSGADTKVQEASAPAHIPFVWIVKRDDTKKARAYIIRAAAFVGALLTGAVLILAMGLNPLLVYRDMASGSLGGALGRTETVRIAVPLLVTAMGIGLAFKMRFWNIGAEGQIIAGAMAATWFALFSGLSSPLMLIAMLLAAMITGGLWGLIPAFFKARWNTNETLFTLMLNYIALEIVRYFQNGPWRDPKQRGFPKIAIFGDAARLPRVFGVHIGWIIALVLVALVYVYMKKTKHGYEITVVGESLPTARYAGMNVGRVFLRTMFLSGALCGLTGFLLVSGSNYTLSESVTGGVGFTAITVAWLSKLNPVVMIAVSLFIAILQRGANTVQTTFKLPSSAADILTGLILFFMLGCEFFLRYRLVFRRRKEGARHG